MLSSRFSMWMAWGPELTFFCNDAYRRDTLGKKYPWALGAPAREVWAEIWPDIGPRIEHVLHHRRGDLGRVAAAVPRAQRVPRGDLPHVLLQPADRRRRARRRHAVRGQRGHRAGDRRAADGDAAGPRGTGAAALAPRPRSCDRRAGTTRRRSRSRCRSRSSTCSTTTTHGAAGRHAPASPARHPAARAVHRPRRTRTSAGRGRSAAAPRRGRRGPAEALRRPAERRLAGAAGPALARAAAASRARSALRVPGRRR